MVIFRIIEQVADNGIFLKKCNILQENIADGKTFLRGYKKLIDRGDIRIKIIT